MKVEIILRALANERRLQILEWLKRIKQWTFYKRDEPSIKKVKQVIVERV
jgi:hypothetical protein